MTTTSDTMHRAFDASVGIDPKQGVDLSQLLDLRRHDVKEYWRVTHDLPPPSLADLDKLMPRDSLPLLVDGTISYHYDDFMSPGTKRKATHRTKAATEAAQFLELVEKIEAADPEFFDSYAQSLFPGASMEYVMLFHLLGERDDLKAKFFSNIKYVEDLITGVFHKIELFEGNTYYPMGSMISRMTDGLAGNYIKRKAPFLKDDRTYVPLEEALPFLEIARDYCYDSTLIKAINTKMPLPQVVLDIHGDGLEAMDGLMKSDMDMSLWMLDRRDRYAELSHEEKLEFGKFYLWLLAKSYGIEPPPEFAIDPECATTACQKTWDPADKYASFAHPMGRIDLKEFPDTCDAFLENLSHEFTHALEDSALLLMNVDYQDWKQHHPDEARIGNEEQQKKLRAIALPLSFNVASGASEVFSGIRAPGLSHGSYYSPVGAKAEPDAEKAKEITLLYYQQMRERHAYTYEGIIADRFKERLDFISLARDPLRVFMRAQLAMGRAEEFIRDKLMPAMPPEGVPEISEAVQKIKTRFKDADAREATYGLRISGMGLAFNEMRDVIRAAGKAKLIDTKDPAVLALYSECNKVFDSAVQAVGYMNWKQDRDDRAAAAASTGAAPAAV